MTLCGNNYKIPLSEGIFMYSSAVSGLVICEGIHKQKVLKEESLDCKGKVCKDRSLCALCVGREGMKRRCVIGLVTYCGVSLPSSSEALSSLCMIEKEMLLCPFWVFSLCLGFTL